MKKTGEAGGVIWSMIKLLIICYIITGIILAGIAFIMWKTNPPAQFVSGGILFAYVMSSFVGGFVVGKKAGKRKYLWGILFGLIYFAIVFAVSFMIKGVSGEFPENAATVFMLCISGGMLGGMLGTN